MPRGAGNDERLVVPGARQLEEEGAGERAGLRRGDVLLQADGEPFQPLNPFQSGRDSKLRVLRNGDTLSVTVTPLFECVQRSMLRAMQASLRRIKTDSGTIGYVHLWTGTSPVVQQEFVHLVTDSLANVAGLVLDLRGGFGGAWYEYLDPFFEDRHDFFVNTACTPTSAGVMTMFVAVSDWSWAMSTPCVSE